MNSSNLTKKCKKIKLVISDVDGVLTDGGMYYSSKGEIMKKFNAKDGMGVELLKENNIKTILMTKEKSDIVIKRGKKIKADATLIGISKKEKKIDEICRKFNVNKTNIGYIGDDLNDEGAMKMIGLSASPSNAEQKIHDISDYVCEKKGGDGAFREFVNMIIEKRGKIEE